MTTDPDLNDSEDRVARAAMAVLITAAVVFAVVFAWWGMSS